MNTQRMSLDVINVAEPCTESWEGMSGDDRVRYCQGCRKHVYNLSAMTRSDAERLVCESAGSLCVRFARSETGLVQTLEYRAPAGNRRGWRFWTIVSTCAASLVGGVNGYLLARGRPAPAVPAVLMGDIAPRPAVLLGKPAPVVMGGVSARRLPPTPFPAPAGAADPAN
jgi:hypothetical protein